MTTHPGLLAEAPLLYQQPGRSSQLDELVLNHDAGGFEASASIEGARVNNLPIDQPSITRAGHLAPGFSDDWYYRIHVRPNPLSLGFLLAAQDRTVEVWNAHFDVRTLQAITEQDTDGISLSGPVPPADWQPQQSINYTVSFETSGPPTIDATYTFEFEQNEDAPLRITGQRVALFAHRHNWRASWVERLGWLSDVMVARDGTEQVAGLRGYPRRVLEQELLEANHGAQILDRNLYAWQARVFAVPVASDGEQLAATVEAGATFVPLADTTNRDYHADGLALLSTRPDLAEAVEILSVAANGLTLKNPTQMMWAAGTRVWPARLARLSRNQPLRQVTAGVRSARLRWQCVDRSESVATPGTVSYQGHDVLLEAPNRVAPVAANFERLAEVVDGRTGLWAVDDPAEQSFQADSFVFLARDRAAVQWWREWLYHRRGRVVPFWMPSWQADLEMVGEIGAGSSQLPVRPVSYALFYQGRPGRDHVAIQTTAGDWILRGVSDGTVVGPELEYLLLDAPVGVSLGPGTVRRICWLRLVRLNGDAQQFEWRTAGVAQLRLTVRTKL